MEAEEIHQTDKQKPKGCTMACYLLQNLMCLLIELPLRVCFHLVMLLLCVVFLPLCIFNPWIKEMVSHHWALIYAYFHMAQILVENLLSPCDRSTVVLYVYASDTTLIRPPRPQRPKNPSEISTKGGFDDCCKCDECCQSFCDNLCKCESLEFKFLRFTRSLFCLFSGHHSCHHVQLCGPCCHLLVCKD